MNFAAPGTSVLRNDPTQLTQSGNVSPSLQPPRGLGRRARSSTLSSLNVREDQGIPTPPLPSGRTSTSTTGRASLAGLFNLSYRLRQNSEPPESKIWISGTQRAHDPRFVYIKVEFVSATSGSSRCTRAGMARSLLVSTFYVWRKPSVKEWSPVYYPNLQNPFHKAVLRSYMRGFAIFENPMDMAIRKLLMDVELPKETQQIDRVLQGFADRYHECNPGIYASPDQAYFIAFSLLILHTDVFNKNNKHKMQKPDYIKNTRGEGSQRMSWSVSTTIFPTPLSSTSRTRLTWLGTGSTLTKLESFCFRRVMWTLPKKWLKNLLIPTRSLSTTSLISSGQISKM